LREDCRRRDWSVAGTYVDHISGAKEKKPELSRMMADAKQRRFDAPESVQLPDENDGVRGVGHFVS
jgi:DNA invertase Pin-like site-specific DNA recombinase